MDAALLQDSPSAMNPNVTGAGRIIDAAQFRKLLVSHRRMVRVDRREERLKGLQDLDTGELFLTDERRLIEAFR